ncbi:MAG: molybdate ABC transporter substrate-binding protein [Calditerrivibrio sp.]|nr:molybdate ABC transporter substrate-binding protein [Calditerrivibrio sp.]
MLYGDELSIYCAVGVKPVVDEIIEHFKKQTNTKITVSYGSSGKGFAQLEHGARYDIFISADIYYPKMMIEKGLSSNNYIIYGRGKLALIYSDQFLKNKKPDFNLLKEANKVAIANPKVAPYGKSALQVLMKYGFSDIVNSRLVYGENLSNVLSYLEKGFVDAAFLSYSIVIQNEQLKSRSIIISENDHEPLEHALIITKYGETNQSAKEFVNFFTSKQGKEIIKKYGL